MCRHKCDLYQSGGRGLFSGKHRGLAGLDDVLWTADRMRRIGEIQFN